MDHASLVANCLDALNAIRESCKNLEQLITHFEFANGAGTLTPTDDALIANLRIEVGDSFSEIDDDKDYINELESYLKNLNLSEPYYELMVKKEKSGGTIKLTHICTIKVNDKSVSSSFPVECNSVDFAKQVAAKHALTVLVKQYGENVIYPITNDINTMASRIKEFLKVGFKETGLMGYVLERMYREQFQENLPDNWVQLLEVYSYFTFDKVVANKIIIYLNETENNFHNGHGSTNGHIEAPVEEENIIPGTPLMFEDYEEKSVLVSANYGSSSIWIRFVGQSADENFIQMQAKFNDTMNTTGFSIAEQVSEGEFYGVLYNSSWHRVQVASPADNDGTVTCFMVDTGEQLNISKDQICYLEPMFMKTKTQAIECVLTRLDNFGSFDGLKELLDEMILNKTFFLLPDSLEEGYARVSLYEKGKESDRINVNELIIQRLLEKSIAKLPSIEENAIVDGNVSSIIESGYLYIQLKFDIVTSIEEMLPSDDCLLPEYFLKSKGDVQKDQVYIAKYKDNDDVVWCRAQVVEFVNDTKVKIIFIDYGNNSVCEVTELVDLYMFDPLMAMIPPQAIKVSMHLVPPNIMTTEIAQKIFSIIGNDKILVNLISVPANDVPCIQLHKFKEDSPDIPLCINIQLAQSLKNNKLPTS